MNPNQLAWVTQTAAFYQRLGLLSDWALDPASVAAQLARPRGGAGFVFTLAELLEDLDFEDESPYAPADLAVLAADTARVWVGPLFARGGVEPARHYPRWLAGWAAVSRGRFAPTRVECRGWSGVTFELDGRARVLELRRFGIGWSDPRLVGEVNRCLTGGHRFVACELPPGGLGGVMMLSDEEREAIARARGVRFPGDLELARAVADLTGETSPTELVRAAHASDPERVRELLVAGVPADARGTVPPYQKWKGEVTALGQAVEQGSLDTVELLLVHGASPDFADARGETALHKADAAPIVELLLARGADVHARSSYRRTPLHEAAVRGNVDVVRRLLTAGADPTARDMDRKTPTAIAREPAVKALLRPKRGGTAAARAADEDARLVAMLGQLRGAGILDAPVWSTARAAGRARAKLLEAFDVEFEPTVAMSYLLAALDERRVACFDASFFEDAGADELYARSLRRLAKISRGRFEPTRVRERWSDDAASVEVAFNLGGRSITLAPHTAGRYGFDWCVLLELNTLVARSRRRFVCARPPDALDLEGVLTLMVTPAEEEHLAAACRWHFHSDAQVRAACPRRARRRDLA